ncbi:transposase [Streptomyces anulatus]|nr:transposase [Streptomyces anulatus]
MSNDLWERIEPLLPHRMRRFRHPGRKSLPDRQVLCGILFVPHTGIHWECLERRRGPGTRAPQDRRPRFAVHHPALPAPAHPQDHGGRGGALRPLQRTARTASLPSLIAMTR